MLCVEYLGWGILISGNDMIPSAQDRSDFKFSLNKINCVLNQVTNRGIKLLHTMIK